MIHIAASREGDHEARAKSNHSTQKHACKCMSSVSAIETSGLGAREKGGGKGEGGHFGHECVMSETLCGEDEQVSTNGTELSVNARTP